MSNWIPKKGLVLIAFESDGDWRPYGLFPELGPPVAALHKEWKWFACTLRSSGEIQYTEKPVGARRWQEARMIA